jgi:hypothetical protein
MPESSVIRTKRDGLTTITNGIVSYVVSCETGDFASEVPLETVNNFLDRGSLGCSGTKPSIRKGDDQPVTFSFSAYLKDLGDTAASYSTLLDILFQYDSGYFDTTWTSTMGTDSDVSTVTVIFTVDGSAFGEADKSLTFSYCVLRGSFSEGDPNTINVTGTSYAVRPALS